MDKLINVLVTITVIEMMIAIGLGVKLGDLMGILRDWKVVTRATVANYVCVPAVTVILLLFVHPHPMVAAGFLILAVCPGAPYGPSLTAIAKGNVTAAVGLMVLLAGSSAILAPILLRYLLLLMSGGEAPEVDTARIALVLLTSQLIPLCVGVALRQMKPTLADRLQATANSISKVLNLCSVGLVLVAHFHFLTEIRPRGIVAMLALLLASLVAGWLLSDAATDTRKAMAVTTSLRNVAVGLVLATNMFAGTPAVTAVVAFGLVSLFGTLAFAKIIEAVIPVAPAAIGVLKR